MPPRKRIKVPKTWEEALSQFGVQELYPGAGFGYLDLGAPGLDEMTPEVVRWLTGSFQKDRDGNWIPSGGNDPRAPSAPGSRLRKRLTRKEKDILQRHIDLARNPSLAVDPNKIMVFDLETSGIRLPAAGRWGGAQLREVGAVNLAGANLLPRGIGDLTGLHMELAGQTAKGAKDVNTTMRAFLASVVQNDVQQLVGHNVVAFDLPHLVATMRKMSYHTNDAILEGTRVTVADAFRRFEKLADKTIDTRILHTILYPKAQISPVMMNLDEALRNKRGLRPRNLLNILSMLKPVSLQVKDLHTAEADARATAGLLRVLLGLEESKPMTQVEATLAARAGAEHAGLLVDPARRPGVTILQQAIEQARTQPGRMSDYERRVAQSMAHGKTQYAKRTPSRLLEHGVFSFERGTPELPTFDVVGAHKMLVLDPSLLEEMGYLEPGKTQLELRRVARSGAVGNRISLQLNLVSEAELEDMELREGRVNRFIEDYISVRTRRGDAPTEDQLKTIRDYLMYQRGRPTISVGTTTTRRGAEALLETEDIERFATEARQGGPAALPRTVYMGTETDRAFASGIYMGAEETTDVLEAAENFERYLAAQKMDPRDPEILRRLRGEAAEGAGRETAERTVSGGRIRDFFERRFPDTKFTEEAGREAAKRFIKRNRKNLKYGAAGVVGLGVFFEWREKKQENAREAIAFEQGDVIDQATALSYERMGLGNPMATSDLPFILSDMRVRHYSMNPFRERHLFQV